MVASVLWSADAIEDEHPVRTVALHDVGARRLLTPEELARKTAALTGGQWGCEFNDAPNGSRWPSDLTEDYRLLYGGIDSDGIIERARDVTSVMAAVAETHAVQISCPVIMREFFLLPDGERRLFAGIDRQSTPDSDPDAIRSKLVELHERLLGVQVTPHSPDVEAAYRLFVDTWQYNRDSGEAHTNFRNIWCDWGRDLFFYEGILDDAVVEHVNDDGKRWYGYDWDHVNAYMDGLDWSDPHYSAQTWIVVLAYFLMDYRYLYL